MGNFIPQPVIYWSYIFIWRKIRRDLFTMNSFFGFQLYISERVKVIDWGAYDFVGKSDLVEILLALETFSVI